MSRVAAIVYDIFESGHCCGCSRLCTRAMTLHVGATTGGRHMITALTPLEFARRTRRLYPEREAVVDGDLRLSYEQFFARCDRWAAALQGLGVVQGDRVAYI